MKSFKLVVRLICLAFLMLPVCCWAAQQGQQDGKFQTCMVTCTSSCVTLSPILRLMQWDCRDDRRYQCMWQDVEFRQKSSLPIVQYYGKWPFIRVFGLQELASVVFSLLNLAMHVIKLQDYQKLVPFSYSLRPWVLGYGCICINVWIWSTIFHSRDTPITERLDYFSAFLTSMYGCFLALIRVLGIRRFREQSLVLLPFGAITFAYMGFYAFRGLNYELNMHIHVVVSLITIGLWSYSAHLHRQSHARTMFLCFVLLALFMSFELGDFPPILFLVDAHALWHLGTVFVIVPWYDFLTKDALYDWKQSSVK